MITFNILDDTDLNKSLGETYRSKHKKGRLGFEKKRENILGLSCVKLSSAPACSGLPVDWRVNCDKLWRGQT